MKSIILIFMLTILRIAAVAQVNTFEIDSVKLNKPLMLVLDTIYQDDQADRLKLPGLKKNKRDVDSLWIIIREKDSQNLVKVKAIINKYGWLGPQEVGFNGSQALFMVIQHADLTTQERYLPMIKDAVKNRKTLSSNLAILEDRVAMRKGINQIYGSQTITDRATGNVYIYPIADPDKVDERRKAMGMPSMADYCKAFNIKWNLDEYKKSLSEIEKITKIKPQ